MSRKSLGALCLPIALFLLPTLAAAHCQIPCGIYDDAARVARMYEDAATIEKAIVQMQNLAGKADPQSANQMARWITVKEEHASNIQTIVAEYFLTQKVKPVAGDDEAYGNYLAKLADHHLVMVAAMKAKQGTDPELVVKLRAALDRLGSHYDLEHKH